MSGPKVRHYRVVFNAAGKMSIVSRAMREWVPYPGARPQLTPCQPWPDGDWAPAGETEEEALALARAHIETNLAALRDAIAQREQEIVELRNRAATLTAHAAKVR